MNRAAIAATQATAFLGARETDQLLDELMPRVLPSSWSLAVRGADGMKFDRDDGLSVILSVAREADGRRWLHVSCARRTRLPSYDELKVVKNLFVGAERAAVQVFPEASKHVNLHSFCLHLFSCLDGDPLPDFTHGTGSL